MVWWVTVDEGHGIRENSSKGRPVAVSGYARGRTKGIEEWKDVLDAITVCIGSGGGVHGANVQVYPRSTRPQLRVDYAKEPQF